MANQLKVKQSLGDQVAMIYVLASVGLAIMLAVLAFFKGVSIVGAPKWAWLFWGGSLFLAITIARFLGDSKHIRTLIVMGLFPLLLVLLAGTMGSPPAHVPMNSSPAEVLLDLGKIYEMVWIFALVITPIFLLMLAFASWYYEENPQEDEADLMN